jgi:thiol-disulfide isomerase/thioredoxin
MNFGRAPRRRSRLRLHAVVPAALAAGALTLTACGGGTSGGGGDTNFVTNAGGIDTVAKADRRPLNDIRGTTLDGTSLDVSSLKGKVVVINVWGSWCSPCRAEAPNLVKAANADRSKGVAFVGIDTRDTVKGNGVAFEKAFHLPYPNLYDPTGKLIVDGFPKGSLNPQAIPSTIVLDRQGRIAARALTALSESKLDAMLKPLIAEK